MNEGDSRDKPRVVCVSVCVFVCLCVCEPSVRVSERFMPREFGESAGRENRERVRAIEKKDFGTGKR